MKFLVDAQLPRKLAQEITRLGGEAVHTLDLPRQNRTGDGELIALSMREGRTAVSKDSDFVDSFILRGKPAKLLLISTGNIPNRELLQILRANWEMIQLLFTQGDFIEMSRTSLILHA